MMGQSYATCFYACTRTNHAPYSSVQVTFCGSGFGKNHIEQYHKKLWKHHTI